MNEICWQATTTGCCAARFLESDRTLEVSGSTSRGVFLRTPEHKIIFITSEGNHSPITINLPADAREALRLVQAGESAQREGEIIHFNNSRLSLITPSGDCWSPPPPPIISGTTSDFFSRLHTLCRLCTDQEPGGFGLLLALRLNRLSKVNLPAEASLAHERCRSVVENFHYGSFETTMGSLEKLLGMGRGLTPSGDDFAEGLLLLFNRWQHAICPEFDARAFNLPLIAAARRRTTALSATLIECAAAGGADERLLAAVDFIFCGQPAADRVANGLLNLGNSSGVDALFGMAIALDVGCAGLNRGDS